MANMNQTNKNIEQLDAYDLSNQKNASLPISIGELSKNLKIHPPHRVRLRHYIIMSFFFCLLIWSMIWLVKFDSHKCTIDQETLDSCAQRLLFFSSETDHFPKTGKQLDVYCNEKRESIQCLRRYVSSCLDVDKRQKKYFKKFVLNYKKQLDNTCLRVSEREKFISYSGCLSEADLIQNATHCMDVHQNQLLYIAENVPENRKMAAACCSLHLRHKCLTSNISHRCQRQVQRFVMDQIEGPFRGLFETMCAPNYLSLEGCQRSIETPLWHKIFEQPNTLVRKYSALNDTLDNEILGLATEHTSSNQTDDTEANTNGTTTTSEQREHHLRTKIVQLKFHESFLAFIFIIRHNSQ